jgi:hypothetical protein
VADWRVKKGIIAVVWSKRSEVSMYISEVCWNDFIISRWTSRRVTGAASLRSGLSKISVRRGFMKGFSGVGIVYSFPLTAALNASRTRPWGNSVKSIIVAAITAGIATRYPLTCVKRNRMTEK